MPIRNEDSNVHGAVLILLIAVFLRWPRAGTPAAQWWPLLIVTEIVIVAAFAVLSVTSEESLPALVVDGTWTSLEVAWLYALLAALTAGTVLSARRYQQTGNSLLYYVALAEMLLAFAILAPLIGGKRYDLWWYWQRFFDRWRLFDDTLWAAGAIPLK